mmetsp:Transcript_41573/g.69296  ORF Transcript_41573/g.69296 Transcript_41573/m.69296 type:complete len:217 (+) Transcript_41573:56-706(+)
MSSADTEDSEIAALQSAVFAFQLLYARFEKASAVQETKAQETILCVWKQIEELREEVSRMRRLLWTHDLVQSSETILRAEVEQMGPFIAYLRNIMTSYTSLCEAIQHALCHIPLLHLPPCNQNLLYTELHNSHQLLKGIIQDLHPSIKQVQTASTAVVSLSEQLAKQEFDLESILQRVTECDRLAKSRVMESIAQKSTEGLGSCDIMEPLLQRMLR